MIAKLRDDISFEEFSNLSFGTKGREYILYQEYFSTENLRKPTTARYDGDILYVKIIEADGDTMELPYEGTDSRAIWELYNT
jgi:hypothetical protein